VAVCQWGGARREGRKEGEGEASARVVSRPRESKEGEEIGKEESNRIEVPMRLLLLLVLMLVLLSLPARKGGAPRERRRRRRVAVKVLVMLATSKRTIGVMSTPVGLPRPFVCCVCVGGLMGRWEGEEWRLEDEGGRGSRVKEWT